MKKIKKNIAQIGKEIILYERNETFSLHCKKEIFQTSKVKQIYLFYNIMFILSIDRDIAYSANSILSVISSTFLNEYIRLTLKY